MLLRIGSFLTLLGAEAWLIHAPDWEPLILFAGSFFTLADQEYKNHKKCSKKQKDKKLFEDFLKEFPSTSDNITFLKEHDFRYSFRLEYIKNFSDFILGEYKDNRKSKSHQSGISRSPNRH